MAAGARSEMGIFATAGVSHNGRGGIQCSPRSLIPLALQLHRVLFPIGEGGLFYGTDEEPDAVRKLYADMIAAFEEHV
jgi:hypothetical protein